MLQRHSERASERERERVEKEREREREGEREREITRECMRVCVYTHTHLLYVTPAVQIYIYIPAIASLSSSLVTAADAQKMLQRAPQPLGSASNTPAVGCVCVCVCARARGVCVGEVVVLRFSDERI
jgi:hypothetical protein